MVYDAFKQVILIVVITVFCISNSTGQNKIKDFSTEYDVYLKELSDLMLSSDNSDLKSNYKINLERSLRLGDEISGHFVFGHVDETAIISKISPVDDSHLLCIKVSSKVSRFLVKKGSVAINGVSLTINDVKKCQIFINIIPFTWKHTNLRSLKPGSRINLEVDMLARYVTKNLKK